MKILVVVGTRPEAIKMAPVIKELRSRDGKFDVAVCLTAQHREMLDQVMALFSIKADYDLDLMSEDQTIFDVTAGVLLGMQRVLEESAPDLVLVHGDTTTSFAAALACHYKQCRVGHVEAGLRTHDKWAPFPEEMNRVLGDALCDLHFAPTEGARENLLRENVADDHIWVTGNTVIDALLDVSERSYEFDDPVLNEVGIEKRLILVTAHRRESFGPRFEEICTAMRDLVLNNSGIEIVFPVHPNPNVGAVVRAVLGNQDRVHLVDPLDYLPFVHLLKKAYLVLTDSGGVQEEAPSLGKPVLVMREVTERPEAVQAGTAKLVGNTYDGVLTSTQEILDDDDVYAAMANAINPYGDGLASKRIVDKIEVMWAKK